MEKLKTEELMIKEINGGVTAPKGFAAVGIAAGIKKGKKDRWPVLLQQMW